MGGQFEINYMIPRGSKLGGKYGTQLSLNTSMANSIDKGFLEDGTRGEKGTQGYTSNPFAFGPIVYFRDVNASVTRKFSKKFKSQLTLFNFARARGPSLAFAESRRTAPCWLSCAQVKSIC